MMLNELQFVSYFTCRLLYFMITFISSIFAEQRSVPIPQQIGDGHALSWLVPPWSVKHARIAAVKIRER
jgi:hypothetical protein